LIEKQSKEKRGKQTDPGAEIARQGQKPSLLLHQRRKKKPWI
jgi:hypothetical protein